ncbi:MAG: hypothetical protein ACE5KU_06985, partial [Nitrososphaerales archaeon]
SSREICSALGLSIAQVSSGLRRCWESGIVLRTKGPLYEGERVFKGRGGVSRHTRPYHLFVMKRDGSDSLVIAGREFVSYSREFLDPRGGGGESKASLILDFLKENKDRAFFSKQVCDALKDRGVRPADVMSAVRRFERQDLVYVRGYRRDSEQTPFQKGYLLTWIDQKKPAEEALDDAIKKTNLALEDQASTSPIIHRVHKVRSIILEASKLRELVGFLYIKNSLRCSENEALGAVTRALQLYPDLCEVKLFNAFRYFHNTSMPKMNLEAAVQMKENHIRMTKGRMNRIGHNWEACVEWFLDRFTEGAKFWTQDHRSNMDPRRITIHLVKSVRGRVANAEVDRVWSVTPGLFAQPITYVLECKWGLVSKRDVDDFFEILRWSTDFGADTPEGRQLKQGVVGAFAGSSFNPRENILLKDGSKVSLASYAGRLNVQILKAADFNKKLHERGVPSDVTVQKICKTSRDEDEVRKMMDRIWEKPEDASSVLSKALDGNRDVYDFEKMLLAK